MKKLMMVLIIVIVIVSFTSCTVEIEYSKDERTGLCFAHQMSMTNNGSLID